MLALPPGPGLNAGKTGVNRNAGTIMGATSRYDVVIVGGGPVGLTLAASLLHFQSDLSIAVLDRRPFDVPSDARASALAAGVRRVLEAIDIWSLVEKGRLADQSHAHHRFGPRRPGAALVSQF